uniref:Uncharacterized protein n=1 Tax=Arundo donax TaxID=35708 RepID=A0A0A9EDW7_ARUDO
MEEMAALAKGTTSSTRARFPPAEAPLAPSAFPLLRPPSMGARARARAAPRARLGFASRGGDERGVVTWGV